MPLIQYILTKEKKGVLNMKFFIFTVILGLISLVTSAMVEAFIYKAMFFMFSAFVCLPICFNYLMNVTMKTLKDTKKNEDVSKLKDECKKTSKNKGVKQSKNETKIVNNEQYKSLVEFLKFSMQKKLLNRQDILKFKKEINSRLGEYKDNYYGFEFQNDLHEIYTKLKSSHLSSNDYEELLKSLESYVV